MECVCSQTRPQLIVSTERVLGNGVKAHVNSKVKILSSERLQGGSNPRCCITLDSEPNTWPTALFRPQRKKQTNKARGLKPEPFISQSNQVFSFGVTRFSFKHMNDIQEKFHISLFLVGSFVVVDFVRLLAVLGLFCFVVAVVLFLLFCAERVNGRECS